MLLNKYKISSLKMHKAKKLPVSSYRINPDDKNKKMVADAVGVAINQNNKEDNNNDKFKE